jgi:hypothetical protein
MIKLNLYKNCLYALLLAFMAAAMLPACSSSDEAAQEDTGTSGSSSCEDACRSDQVPDFQLDECLMACGAS